MSCTLTPLARVELEAIAPAEGLIFGRHAALIDLAEVTQSVGAVAAVAGYRDLRTTSRYFNARERAATAALRARTAADQELETGRITGTITGTARIPGSSQIILPRKNGDGRVAQLDRALPSGGRSRGFESLRVRRKSWDRIAAHASQV